MRGNRPLLKAQRSLLVALSVVVAGITLSSCSGGQPLAPPTETFPLPSNAPPDAAAPPGTTRVLVTAIQIFTPDGRAANPAALQGNASDSFRIWIFCPKGLEGSFEYAVSSIGLSGSGSKLQGGYNNVDGAVVIRAQAGSYPFRFDVIREFVAVASKEITLVVTP